jgi:hypothetical protein
MKMPNKFDKRQCPVCGLFVSNKKFNRHMRDERHAYGIMPYRRVGKG